MTEAALSLAHEKLSYFRVCSRMRADDPGLKAELFRLRQSVARLPERPEKLYIYCHYVQGLTNEACAEDLGISRRSVYRLRRRALWLYARENRLDAEVDNSGK